MQVNCNQSDQTKYGNTSDTVTLQDEDASFEVAKFIIYIVILVVSTTGNSLLIGVISRSPRMRSKPGNLLILNLALCDLALPMISIPFDLVIQETAYQWPFGRVMCKLLGPLATLAVTSSSLTLACISLDRHRALLHPFKTRLSLRHVKYMISSLHLFSLIVVIPYAIHLDILDDRHCAEYWPVFAYRQAYTLALALAQYFIPLFFMSWMYILSATKLYRSSSKLKRILSSQEEKNFTPPSVRRSFRIRQDKNLKVTKMFSIIVIIFVIFTLPNQIFWIWSDFADGYKHTEAVFIAIVCHWFTYANSCLNPVVFFAYGRDFNNRLRQFIRRLIFKEGSDMKHLQSIWRETMIADGMQTGISMKNPQNMPLEKLEMTENIA